MKWTSARVRYKVKLKREFCILWVARELTYRVFRVAEYARSHHASNSSKWIMKNRAYVPFRRKKQIPHTASYLCWKRLIKHFPPGLNARICIEQFIYFLLGNTFELIDSDLLLAQNSNFKQRIVLSVKLCKILLLGLCEIEAGAAPRILSLPLLVLAPNECIENYIIRCIYCMMHFVVFAMNRDKIETRRTNSRSRAQNKEIFWQSKP